MMIRGGGQWLCLGLAVLLLGPAGRAATRTKALCARVDLEGEVSSGGQWRAPFGQGWVFRLLPIAGYSGWDLVVDREQPAGFPDALLIATMPYGSMNEREIGTSFGLRAQDAIGWNPRSFRFVADPEDFRRGQRLYHQFMQGHTTGSHDVTDPNSGQAQVMDQLLMMHKRAPAGEFRILDARISPGIVDPAPYAQNWALTSSRTPHTVEAPAGGKVTGRGTLNWMRFQITLWLPSKWSVPAGIHAASAACTE